MALKGKTKNGGSSMKQEYQPLNLNNTDINLNDEREIDQQGNKIVEINRLLSNDQYGIGKQLQDFKAKFIQDLIDDVEFKNPAKYVSQLNSFIRIKQEAIAASGNLGSLKLKNWIPLSNQVVEKFIYHSVYDKLFDKFASKHVDQDGLYFKKVHKLRDYSDFELLENLE